MIEYIAIAIRPKVFLCCRMIISVCVKPNILVMGRAAFMRVPVSEANDLNYLCTPSMGMN